MTQVLFGNTNNLASGSTGWFVGHFVNPPDDLRSTEAVEIKWHTHPAGDAKPAWTKSTIATSLAVLISGRFKFSFPDQDVLLKKQGDYVLWPPGTFHTWTAEEESVILTIRWPSKVEDVVIAEEEQVRQFQQGRNRLD